MKFYRYKMITMDEYWADIRVIEMVYSLVKETPKGYWIEVGYRSKKWIPKKSKKRFAYPTKKEAMINFIKRTERHIGIMAHKTQSAERALVLANTQLNKLEK